MKFDPLSMLIGAFLVFLLMSIHRVSSMTSGPESFAKARADACPEGYKEASTFLCVKK